MTSIVKRLLGASALCALGLGPALAADIPVKAVPLPVSVYNWTGIYIGVHAGYGKGMKDWNPITIDYDVSGWLGGGQIGVNQQIGNWVIGLEADASWSNIKGSQTLVLGGPLFGFLARADASTTVDSIVTLAGRIGFAQDRWLVYVKLGGAWVRENHSLSIAQTTVPVGAAPIVTQATAVSGRDDRFGAMLGIGSEFALWGNWSFKSEYNYIHLPTGSAVLTGTQTLLGVTTPIAQVLEIRQSLHLAKFGFNYRFGPDSPPAIMPSRPAPGYNWTGAWVGVQAAYGFGTKTWPDFAAPNEFNVDGWAAGVSTGANVQAGVFVLGVESEWLWSRIDGSLRVVTAAGATTQTRDFATRVDWMSLNSVRIGFAGFDRWLVYVKGGVALAKETHDLGIALVAPGVGSDVITLSGNALHTGYLAGIGVEHAFLGNWSAKLEYNYIRFRQQDALLAGIETINTPGLTGSIQQIIRVSVREDIHLVKFGINYHFNSFADVITARY